MTSSATVPACRLCGVTTGPLAGYLDGTWECGMHSPLAAIDEQFHLYASGDRGGALNAMAMLLVDAAGTADRTIPERFLDLASRHDADIDSGLGALAAVAHWVALRT